MHLGVQHVNLRSTDRGQKNARAMHLEEQHDDLKWPDRGQRSARDMHLGMRECPGQYSPAHMLKEGEHDGDRTIVTAHMLQHDFNKQTIANKNFQTMTRQGSLANENSVFPDLKNAAL